MINELIERMRSGPLGDFFLDDKEALFIKKEMKDVINNYEEGENDGDDVYKLICAMFVCSDVPLENLMKELKKEKVIAILRDEYVREVDWWSDPEGFNFENSNEYFLNPISNMYYMIQEIEKGKTDHLFNENQLFEVLQNYVYDNIKERLNKDNEKLLIEDGSFLYPYLKYLKAIEKLNEFIDEWGKEIINEKLKLINKKVEEV
jgi:hypothetical protein